MRLPALVAAWSMLLGGLASAMPPSVTRSAMLPTRRADASALASRTAALARRLDEQRGVSPAGDAGAAIDLAPTLDRADQVLAEGKVDDAAVLLDLALDLGSRSPSRVSNPSSFLHAHILRASVALARRETGRAQALLARALRYDPTLTLLREESSPRVHAAFDEAQRALGPRPPIDAQVLGELGQARVLVGRAAPNGQLELALFEHGTAIASVVSRGADDDEILRALTSAPATSVPTSPPSTAAVVRSPSLGDATAAPAIQPPTPPERSHRRRAWLWVTLAAGAVTVGGVVAAIVLTRSPAPSASDWNVSLHY